MKPRDKMKVGRVTSMIYGLEASQWRENPMNDWIGAICTILFILMHLVNVEANSKFARSASYIVGELCIVIIIAFGPATT